MFDADRWQLAGFGFRMDGPPFALAIGGLCGYTAQILPHLSFDPVQPLVVGTRQGGDPNL